MRVTTRSGQSDELRLPNGGGGGFRCKLFEDYPLFIPFFHGIRLPCRIRTSTERDFTKLPHAKDPADSYDVQYTASRVELSRIPVPSHNVCLRHFPTSGILDVLLGREAPLEGCGVDLLMISGRRLSQAQWIRGPIAKPLCSTVLCTETSLSMEST